MLRKRLAIGRIVYTRVTATTQGNCIYTVENFRKLYAGNSA